MTTRSGKRVSAKEAAEILGVPANMISRIDRQGEIIKRYKLGHKTHVYELESLYAFLDAKLVKPVPRPAISSTSGAARRVCEWKPDVKQTSSLREFLREELKKR